MNHEGFIAEVGYEDGDRLMHGSVINTRAVLRFAGGNIEELRQAFADTIADYRKRCKERGVEPEYPSGALSFYRRVDEEAATLGENINQFIARHLEEAANLARVHANERPAWMRCIRAAIQVLHVDFASGRTMPSEGQVIRELDKYAAAIAKVRELDEPGALAKPLEGIVLRAAMTAIKLPHASSCQSRDWRLRGRIRLQG